MDWFWSLLPQQDTPPASSSTQVWLRPVVTATMVPSPAATVDWPEKLSPQQVTRPASSTAQVWAPPQLTSTMVPRPAGTVVWPRGVVAPAGHPAGVVYSAAVTEVGADRDGGPRLSGTAVWP